MHGAEAMISLTPYRVSLTCTVTSGQNQYGMAGRKDRLRSYIWVPRVLGIVRGGSPSSIDIIQQSPVLTLAVECGRQEQMTMAFGDRPPPMRRLKWRFTSSIASSNA